MQKNDRNQPPSQVARVPGAGGAGRPPRLCWYAGPPFTEALMRGCVARAGGEAVPLLNPGLANDVDAVAARIVARTQPDDVCIAHGLAVPALIRALALGATPRAAVLSNGPITRLDPVTRGWQGLGALLPVALAPAIVTRWLRSSAGLRRAVCNPYIMDRDTLATIADPLFSTNALRRAVSEYLRSLATLPALPVHGAPMWMVWGDDDPLYPLSEADSADVILGGGRVIAIPGGRFGHPEERPWALADCVTALCSKELSAAPP
jgi:hypothetical protein